MIRALPLLACLPATAAADPWIAPGDVRSAGDDLRRPAHVDAALARVRAAASVTQILYQIAIAVAAVNSF